MKTTVIAAALLTCLAFAAPAANAKGCVKGAAVGGIAGHFVHHHGLLGAVAGCAIGHHHAKVTARKQQQQPPQQQASR